MPQIDAIPRFSPDRPADGAVAGARKLHYNRRLFSVVAPRYDVVTRLLSWGRDQAWKRWLVKHVPVVPPHGLVVDLACGTGDITRRCARRFAEARVLGCDASMEMLREGRRRGEGSAVPEHALADMSALPLRDQTVNVVTGGYALRNAPDLERTLSDVARVLIPGGSAAFLDFSRSPRPAVWRAQYTVLRAWGALWGIILHGNPHIYTYIAHSLATFPDRTRLRELMRHSGLQVVRSRKFFMGFAEAVVCRKV